MTDLNIVKAITVDLDDTLWPVGPAIQHAETVLQNWLQQHAPQASSLWAVPGLAKETRQQVALHHPQKRHDLSFLRRETIREVITRAGEPPELADAAFVAFFLARQRVTLFDDCLPTLEALSATYPLIALSNGNADILQIGISGWFTASVSASQAGFPKPDPRIFHAAAQLVGFEPEQILHVGDDPVLDVQAARNAGLQAVWLNRKRSAWTLDADAPLEIDGLQELVSLLHA